MLLDEPREYLLRVCVPGEAPCANLRSMAQCARVEAVGLVIWPAMHDDVQ